jgi:predicted ester cyclase
MSVEENKDSQRRFIEEVLNTGDFGRMEEFCAPHIAAHLTRDFGRLRQAFPDLHLNIEKLIGEGDMVAVRFTLTGTNTGSFQGRPPTNKRATWTGIVMTRHAEGKAVEDWRNIDIIAVMQQLGIVPQEVFTVH